MINIVAKDHFLKLILEKLDRYFGILIIFFINNLPYSIKYFCVNDIFLSNTEEKGNNFVSS